LKADIEAAKILAARKIELLDIGQVNKRFFITSVEIGFEAEHKTRKDVVQENISPFVAARRTKKFKPQPVKVWMDTDYRISSNLFNLSIINIAEDSRMAEILTGAGRRFAICMVPYSEELMNKSRLIAQRKYDKLPNASVFHASHVRVEGPRTVKVATDGVLYDHLPVDMQVIPETLRVIVGKRAKT